MQQRDIDSLIDGADEPEPWPRKLPDLGVSRGDIAAHREMLAVDAVRAQRDVRLAFAAHFVCARTTAEHDVRNAEHRVLPLDALARRALERSEFVETIVDDDARVQTVEHRKRHRRAEPHAIIGDALVRNGPTEKLRQQRNLVIVESGRGERRVRRQHGDAVLYGAKFASRIARVEYGLLDVEHAPLARKSRENVLWPLHGVPTHMREDDQRLHRATAMRRRLPSSNTRPTFFIHLPALHQAIGVQAPCRRAARCRSRG